MVDLVAQLEEDRAVVHRIRTHQGDPEAERIPARRVELGGGETEIGGADRRIGQAVVERRREPRVEIVRTQRLEGVAIHRERLGGTLVRERLCEIP